MKPDGRKIAKDLISHRNLWETVLSEQIYEGKEELIKLRELERCTLGAAVICIGIKSNKRVEFENLAQMWNPLTIQYMPVQERNDEMVVELCFG